MALTQNDLMAFSKLLDGKLDEKLSPIHGYMTKIDGRLDGFEQKIEEIRSDLDIVKEDVGILKEDVGILKEDVGILKEAVCMLKEEVKILKEAVKKLEARVTQLEYRVKAIELCLENEIKRDIRILAENYLPATQHYEKAEEERRKLRDDVGVLVITVQHHSEELCELKKMLSAS